MRTRSVVIFEAPVKWAKVLDLIANLSWNLIGFNALIGTAKPIRIDGEKDMENHRADHNYTDQFAFCCFLP
jgi:hypothetical protein